MSILNENESQKSLINKNYEMVSENKKIQSKRFSKGISFPIVIVDYNCSRWRRPRTNRSSSEDRESWKRTDDGKMKLFIYEWI